MEMVLGHRIPFSGAGRQAIEALRALLPSDAEATWRVRFEAPPLAGGTPSEALAARLGVKVGWPVDFWTEAALFAQAGLTAVVLGPGSIAQAHAADEWVALAQLREATAIYERLISGALSGAAVEAS